MNFVKGHVRSAAIAALAVLAVAVPSAHAVYGPEGVQPIAAPGGFTQIVTSKTITAAGGSLVGNAAGAKVAVTVPEGLFDEPLQLRMLKPDLDTLTEAIVESGFDAEEAIAGVGIAASRQNGEAVGRFPGRIRIALQIRQLPRHARVLRYDATKGKYVHIHFTRGRSYLVVRTLKPQALAVVAPRGNDS